MQRSRAELDQVKRLTGAVHDSRLVSELRAYARELERTLALQERGLAPSADA